MTRLPARIEPAIRAILGAAWLTIAACGRNPAPAQPAPSAADRPAGAPPAQAGQDTAGGAGPRAATPQPRPYNRVITPEARTVAGLFKAHRIGDRLYFEIPRAELDREMIVVTRTVSGGSGTAVSPGGANLFVQFERDGNRIRLRRNTYQVAADSEQSIARAVDAIRYGPIIASFNVESWGPDSSAVIEVTRLFTTNITEFAVVNAPQADRSYVERVAAYPENVNVEATQTGTQAPQTGPVQPGGGAGARPQTVTLRVSWSFLRLSEIPMMPRLHDKRVGYINSTFIDYSRPEHEATERRFIHRFRLEKQNPQAAVSDPVEPIVFWIDPATPDWLVPWVRRGVEAWRPAFDGAGFSNAITARTAPTPEEDPDWSMHDARHSMIYWRPSTIANATGGQTVDPRSGQILKAEVNMYHNVMSLLRDWYFTQVGPLDARARKLPLPDSLMGRLVEYVVAHEVGHAIGYPHNMKASAMYPADSVRSASFLRRMGGHVATLMDYSRFNYVAQPEDNIPPALLIPDVGPYDRFVVMWGHRPIPGARSPDDERPTLDQWARMQDTIPWFRFTTDDSPNDPFNLTEAVGDQDAVKSSTLGLRNLQRVMDMMLDAAEKPGEDYTLLEGLYDNAVSQWGRYNSHVAAIVGSAETQEKYGTGPRFTPTSRARQQEALRYLSEHAFRVPDWLLADDILRRIEAEGVVNRVRSAQSGVVNSVLGAARLNRLVEYEALSPAGTTYTIADLIGDLESGIWSELTASRVRIDVFRRNLQRACIEAIERVLYPPRPATQPAGPPGLPGAAPLAPSDARPALRGHLVELDRRVESAIGRAADGMTRLHLRDIRLEIERLLDPKVARSQ
ncbi:MAG: zinc-dependent metalloprotease [Gemmatimonadetes bacterium]|nr:zinc-dependent metalloprotease [Gemmatimonadota bacterium]